MPEGAGVEHALEHAEALPDQLLAAEVREGEGLSGEASSRRYPEVPFGELNVVKYEIIIYWSGDDEAFIAE